MIVSVIFNYYKYYIRIMDIYCFELKYKTKLFTKTIYCGHKQVINKSKW